MGGAKRGSISLILFHSCAQNTHTHTLSIPQHHTDDKDLSQHPQITLHAMFSIRGFLERLSTEPDYTSAPKGSTGCYFGARVVVCCLTGRSAALIPDFHKIKGSAMSKAMEANYRCDTHMHSCANPQRPLSRCRFALAEIFETGVENQPPPPTQTSFCFT